MHGVPQEDGGALYQVLGDLEFSPTSYELLEVKMDNVTQQKIMETIINIRRKNRRPDTDTICKELTKDCASNINADDFGNQIKLVIGNGILESRPSNQGLDSFFILNSNIPISPGGNDIELEQLELGFSPSLATRGQANFSVKPLKFVNKLMRLQKLLIIRILVPNLLQ